MIKRLHPLMITQLVNLMTLMVNLMTKLVVVFKDLTKPLLSVSYKTKMKIDYPGSTPSSVTYLKLVSAV